MKYINLKSALLVIYSIMLLSFVASAQQQVKYAIYDVHTKQKIQISDIVAGVKPNEILVFGEQHGDSIAHAMQQQLANLLFERIGNKLVISMEMFQTDVQHVLDEYLNGWISEANFIKESRAWNNYKDYKPIVELAKKNNLVVVAANTPSRYTNMVSRGGFKALEQLPKKVKKQWLPPFPIDTLTGQYYDNFLEAMGGHVMPNMHIYQSQNLWDATMAYNINKAANNNQNGVVLHLNGKFHSDYYLGTVYRLMNRYKKPVTTISFSVVENIDKVDWNLFVNVADYLIVREQILEKDLKK